MAAPPDHSIGLLGHIAYVGYALRSAGRTLDLGVTDTQWTTYSAASPSIYGAGGGEISRKIHYTEAYAAIAGDNLRFAVQYSPNYIVTHSQALYFDLTGSARPAPEWRVFAHAGYLDPIMKPAGPAVFTSRYDWRVGVSRALGPADLHLALTSHTGPVPSGQTRTALVAGASVYF